MLAHEFGHLLLGPTHPKSDVPGNLMFPTAGFDNTAIDLCRFDNTGTTSFLAELAK